MSTRFQYERDRLQQEKDAIAREMQSVETKYSNFSSEASVALLSSLPPIKLSTYSVPLKKPEPAKISIPGAKHEIPMQSYQKLFSDALPDKNNSREVDLNPPENKRLVNETLLREVSSMRVDYLKSGGNNPRILQQINELEAHALGLPITNQSLELTTGLEAGTTKSLSNVVSDKKGVNVPMVSKDTDITQPLTFEEIDLIVVPPYDEYRGFNVFFDVVTGVPYYGGGNSIKIDMFCAIFNGMKTVCPVECLPSDCLRQPISLIGKSFIRQMQRFYDVAPAKNQRLFVQFSLPDSSDTRTTQDSKPIAWTSFDIFKDDFDINLGRWRLSMFYPPINFKATTYNVYSNFQIVPNMYLYIRVTNPVLQAHHKKIDVTKLDLRGGTASSDYRAYKPSYNNFEEYEDIIIGGKSPGDSLGGSAGDLNAGSARGSRLLGSTNTLSLNQVLYCNLGVRIEQIKNLFLGASQNLRARIKIGNQMNSWTSSIAEAGFDEGTYGWPDEIAEIICNDFAIVEDTRATIELVITDANEESENVLTVEPIVISLFQPLEDRSIVVNEGYFTFNAKLKSSNPCEISLRIFSDAKKPGPFNFDSKRLDKPIPLGSWIKVERDPAIACPEFTNGGTFTFSIDGVRFLPENCTICRIQCQLLTKNSNLLEGVENPVDLLPDLDSPVYFQKFNNKKISVKISAPPCTLTAVIRIFTIDKYTRQLLTVGIALFNFFVLESSGIGGPEGGGTQPVNNDDQPVYLNEGYHQIPVHVCTPKFNFKESGVSVKALKAQRVPCCSILLRLSGSNQELPPKAYHEACYISTTATPLSYEAGLFYFLIRERPTNISIRTSLTILKQDIKAANDDALISWMGRRISKEKGIIPAIDNSCQLKYHEGWGFKISIDAADNLKNKAFSIAYISLAPPATLYSNKRKSLSNISSSLEDVLYNQKLDFTSIVKAPVWQDGFMWYQKYPFNSRLLAVIEIKCLGYLEHEKKYKLQSQGWTILSIFHEGGFVRYGTYQLPLFDGSPTPEQLDSFIKSELEFDELVSSSLKTKKVKYVKKYGTVYVRICDGRRERECVFVKEEAISRNVVQSKAFFDFEDSPAFMKLLPKGVTAEEYQARCLGTLIELTGLPKKMSRK